LAAPIPRIKAKAVEKSGEAPEKITTVQKEKKAGEAQEEQTPALAVNLAQNRNILLVRKGRELALAQENQPVEIRRTILPHDSLTCSLAQGTIRL